MKKVNSHPIMKMMKNSLSDLPTPSNISYMWNWGSLLGIILMIQIISGLMISMHYTPNVNQASISVVMMMRDIPQGITMRAMHINGASMFFIIIYIHIARGIMMKSHKTKETWWSGITIFILLMMTAFMGYVLPWGQMSFWGTTVITNLLSIIPILGKTTVTWLWGDFSVSNPTLNRFFSLHFMLPFIISFMALIHLFSLHASGSSNPSSNPTSIDKIKFHPNFSSKDMISVLQAALILLFLSCTMPEVMSDPENFNPANPLVSPPHIQPEWYFLFAYAILRSIPNKMGGVMALLASIAILYTHPMYKNSMKTNKFIPLKKSLNFLLVSTFALLTWLGANPVEYPFVSIGQLTSTAYFLLFMMMI